MRQQWVEKGANLDEMGVGSLVGYCQCCWCCCGGEASWQAGQWIGKVDKHFNFDLIAKFQVIMAWIRLVHRDETMWGQRKVEGVCQLLARRG